MVRKIMILMIALYLALVSSSYVSATTYKPEYKLSLVIGPQTPWGQAAQKFADLVKERSGGKINVKCYFAGQLFAGMQTNEFLILRQGVADFAVGSTINWSPAVKELNLFSLPFFFPDYRHLDAVKTSDPGKKIFKTIEERGVVGLAWGENGYRELTNSKRSVRKPEDLEGLKVRVVGSPIFVDTFRAMGGNPVSINWSEALTALQQGTVDGQENPVASIIIPYKLWEMNKNITIWHYTIDPLIFGVSKVTWDSFDSKDRDLIGKAAQEAMAWNLKEARKGLEGSTEAIDLLKGKGMDVVVFTSKDMETFKAKTKSVYDKWIPEIGADLVNAAEKIIKGIK
ncbi:MAG: DctP family TRAP transporter solute-binding subunit [Thermodesulfobacteriota bacterium]|nr:DctP family TRAP transporter solute-binding subunit [Thermodesulfobacteriota bacterium]